MKLDLGVYSFGNTPRTADGGHNTAQAIRNVLEAVHVAEQAGLDFFGFGEHHTASMPLSSPLPQPPPRGSGVSISSVCACTSSRSWVSARSWRSPGGRCAGGRFVIEAANDLDPSAADLMLVLLAMAMRWGEAAGLPVQAVNLDRGTVSIVQVLRGEGNPPS
jgi:alkanesulfonate monooxygenase SsuD/methylene tetrahydromethanopterin reductase-like flavin-dependent oxidoreductase (luciferase family)